MRSILIKIKIKIENIENALEVPRRRREKKKTLLGTVKPTPFLVGFD